MPDPRDVLEHEADVALEEAKARIRAAIEEATRDVLAEISTSGAASLRGAARGSSSMEGRVMRAEAARMFNVPMSTLRGLENRGKIHTRRKGGRVMLDPAEVAKALGVAVPERTE